MATSVTPYLKRERERERGGRGKGRRMEKVKLLKINIKIKLYLLLLIIATCHNDVTRLKIVTNTSDYKKEGSSRFEPGQCLHISETSRLAVALLTQREMVPASLGTVPLH